MHTRLIILILKQLQVCWIRSHAQLEKLESTGSTCTLKKIYWFTFKDSTASLYDLQKKPSIDIIKPGTNIVKDVGTWLDDMHQSCGYRLYAPKLRFTLTATLLFMFCLSSAKLIVTHGWMSWLVLIFKYTT